jgi:hypothetical protein
MVAKKPTHRWSSRHWQIAKRSRSEKKNCQFKAGLFKEFETNHNITGCRLELFSGNDSLGTIVVPFWEDMR